MGFDYTLLAGLALYFIVIKIAASTNLKPLISASIVVLSYFTLSTIVKAIILSGYGDAPMWQLFSWVPLSTLAIQFVIALVVFMKLDGIDDAYGYWVLWGTVGFIGIFFLAPFIAASLFASF